MRSLEGAAEVISRGEPLPVLTCALPVAQACRWRCGLNSTRYRARTPYLAAPDDKARAWRDRFAGHEKRAELA